MKLMSCCICKSGQHLARTCPKSWNRDPSPSTGAARADAQSADECQDNADVVMAEDPAGSSLEPEGSPQPKVVFVDDAAGSYPDQPVEQQPSCPAVVDPESVLAGEPQVPSDGTPVPYGSLSYGCGS